VEEDGYLALPVVKAKAGDAAMDRNRMAANAWILMMLIYNGEG